MSNKITIAASLAAAAAVALFIGGCAVAKAEKPADQAVKSAAVDYTAMSPEALAEHLIFEANGYKLDQATQEGGVAKDRVVQDELQKLCTSSKGAPVDAANIIKAGELARASFKYPEGGIKLGDWKKGRELAWSGFGYRIAHKVDDHSKREPGANCYNCHQLATDRTGGTIGPALTGYGKTRGTSEGMLKYTYEVIYNPHAYFPCTNMPRMGANGVLSSQQIADVMAYLLDPESPVNK